MKKTTVFNSEREFETHLRKDILCKLLRNQSDYYLMESKKAVEIY